MDCVLLCARQNNIDRVVNALLLCDCGCADVKVVRRIV